MPSNVSLFESFKAAWRLAAVQERRSAALQAGLRFGAWVLFMSGNFGGYATYKFTVALSSDPRLGEFREAIKRYAEARKQKLEGYKEKAKQRREGIDTVRHASATASAEGPGEESYTKGESVGGTYGQAEERGQSDAPPYQTYQTPSREYELPRSFTADSSSGSSDFFDDASPTAPEYQTSVTSTSKPSSNENAWDRIRRENASRASISAASNSNWGRQRTTTSEYSSYESEQQNGQRERESAQRDFDRMLDAERQVSHQDAGGDESSNSNKKGWRRW
jgi:hypothetical protein